MAVIEGDNFQLTISVKDEVTAIVNAIASQVSSAIKKIPTSVHIEVADKLKIAEKQAVTFERSLAQIQQTFTRLEQKFKSAGVDELGNQMDALTMRVQSFNGSIEDSSFLGPKGLPLENNIAALKIASESVEKLGFALQGADVQIENFVDDVGVTFNGVTLLASQINVLSQKELGALGDALQGNVKNTEEFREILEKNTEQIASTGRASIETSEALKAFLTAAVEQNASLESATDGSSKALGQQRNVVEILDRSFTNFNVTQDEVLGKLVTNTESATNNFDLMAASVKASGVALQATGKIANVFSGGVVGLTEQLETVAPILQESGNALRAMDSEVANVIGTMNLLTGLALKNFAKILNLVIFQIGDLTQKIGIGLFLTMRGMEIRFLSFEKALAQFEFGVKNFSQSLGKDMVGDLKLWQGVLDDTVAKTRFSTTEVAKAIKLIVAEGSFLGVSVDNMVKLTKRAADLAVFTGRNLDDVMLSLLTSLTGNVQAALALGIDMRELALQQTALFKSSGKTFDALSDQEKVQIRLQQVFKKTEPLVGAAAQDLETFTGKSAQLAKQLDLVAIKMGQMGKATNFLITTALGLATAFTNLPNFALELIGNFIDLGGVVFTAAGTITKYVVAITTAITAFKVFNTILREAIVLQKSFTATTAATEALNLALAGNVKNFADLARVTRAVLVAGMAGVVAQFRFAAVAVAGFITTISSLGGILGFLGKTLGAIAATVGKVFVFSLTQFKNLLVLFGPVAAKLALIATLVMAFKEAFEELARETIIVREMIQYASNAFRDVAESVGIVGAKTKDLSVVFKEFASKGLKDVFETLVDLAKLMTQGVLGSVILLAQGVNRVRYAFADNEQEAQALDKQLDALSLRQTQLAGNMVATAIDLVSFGEAMANAAESTDKLSDEMDKLGKSNINPALNQLKEFMKTIDTGSVYTEVLGDQYTQLQVQIGRAAKEQKKATEAFLQGGEDAQRNLESVKQAVLDQARLGAELQKMRIDGIKEISEKTRQMEVDRLEAAGKFAASAQLQSDDAIRAFDEQATRLRQVFKLRQDELAIIEQARAALVAKGEADVSAGRKKENDELLKNAERIADLTERINESRLNAQKEILESEGETLKIIEIENAARLALFDSQVAQLKTLKSLRAEELADLERARDLIIQANEAKMQEARGTTVGDVFDVVAKAFDPSIYVNAFKKGSEIASDSMKKTESILDAGWAGFAAAGREVGSFLADASKDIGKSLYKSISSIKLSDIGDALMEGAEYAYDILSTVFSAESVNFVSDFIEGIANFPQLFMEAVSNLGNVMNSFIENFPKAVNSFVEQLPGLIEKFVAAIPVFIQTLVDNLPKIVQTLVDGLVAAIPAIAQGLAQAIPVVLVEAMKAIGPIIAALVKELPTIVNAIMDGIVQAIPYLVESVIQIIYQLAETLPVLIEGFMERLPQIVEALAKAIPMVALALVDAIIGLFLNGGIERIIGSILRAIPRIIIALVTGIIDGLAEGIKRIFGGGKKFKMDTGTLEKAGEKISNGFKKAGETIKRSTSQLFKVVDAEASARGLDVADRIRNAIASSTNKMANALSAATNKTKSIIEKLWDGLVKVWEWVRDKVLMPVFNFIREVWLNLFENILKPIWEWVINGLTSVFENILKPIWDAIISVLKSVFENIVKPIFETITDAFKVVFEKVAKPIFEGIVSLFKNAFNAIKIVFETIVDLFKGVFDFFKNVGKVFVDLFSGKINLFEAVTRIFGAVGELVSNSLKIVFEGAGRLFDNFIAGLGIVWDTAKKVFAGIGEALMVVWDGAKRVFAGIGEVLNTVWEGAKNIFAGIVEHFKVLWDSVKAIFEGIGNFFQGIFDTVKKSIESLFGFKFPEFKFPKLPDFDWPKMPKFEFPSMPKFSWPSFPKFEFPSLPKFSWPSFPEFKWPKIDLSIPKPSWLEKIGGSLGGFFSDPASTVVKGAENIGTKIANSDEGKKISAGFKNLKKGKISLQTGGLASAFGRIDVPRGKVVNGILHAQAGAMAQGTDTLDAKLTPGEFVVNREATRNNLGLLSFINEVRKPVSPVQGNTNISIIINAKTDLSADQIRREIIPELEKQLRRKSQEGRFVIASPGIRNT